jgi:hypothetical protein
VASHAACPDRKLQIVQHSAEWIGRDQAVNHEEKGLNQYANGKEEH